MATKNKTKQPTIASLNSRLDKLATSINGRMLKVLGEIQQIREQLEAQQSPKKDVSGDFALMSMLAKLKKVRFSGKGLCSFAKCLDAEDQVRLAENIRYFDELWTRDSTEGYLLCSETLFNSFALEESYGGLHFYADSMEISFWEILDEFSTNLLVAYDSTRHRVVVYCNMVEVGGEDKDENEEADKDEDTPNG